MQIINKELEEKFAVLKGLVSERDQHAYVVEHICKDYKGFEEICRKIAILYFDLNLSIRIEDEENNMKFKSLHKEEQEILSQWCEKEGNEHNFVFLKIQKKQKRAQLSHGLQRELFDKIYKCRVCGKTYSVEDYTFTTKEYIASKKEYEKIVPENFDEEICKYLSSNGKNLEEVRNEIIEIEKYSEYLSSLRRRICHMIGHYDMVIWKGYVGGGYIMTTKDCKCCDWHNSSIYDYFEGSEVQGKQREALEQCEYELRYKLGHTDYGLIKNNIGEPIALSENNDIPDGYVFSPKGNEKLQSINSALKRVRDKKK